MSRKNTYEIIPSKHWVNQETGQTASLYGSVPYLTEREKFQWAIVQRGYTVRNIKTGVVGIGRLPWKTEAEAIEWING
jgi:hypothetical protein